MNTIRKHQALEILDYWKMIEFLDQIDILEESRENKKLIKKIESGQKIRDKKIEIFYKLNTPYIQMDKKIGDDTEKYINFPAIGEEIYFCLGKTDRNSIVEYLEKFIDNIEQKPEIAYPKKSTIAWCSFKTDNQGVYLKGSFQLSPILWAISMWERCRAEQNHNFSLNTQEYDKVIENIDVQLQEQNVNQFLTSVLEKIYKDYVKKQFPEALQESIGFYEYNRYIDENERNEDDAPSDYADLGKSYFLNDIILLSKLIKEDKFGSKSEYESKVIDYILSGYDKSKGISNLIRTVISPKESLTDMKKFFEDILSIDKAPSGKWPGKYMPALMQQVAINIAINDYIPIFSVNGPPGTGKTTLLKEIVASNIVERALLLAKNGTDPDSLFEKHSFKHGPLEHLSNAYYQYAPNYYSIKDDKINDYSMLVASCNNAAVENITIDLPKGTDILDSLEASDNENEAVKQGISEIHDLFDINKTEDIETITLYGKSREEKDIYFTRYANNLLGVTDCWGLISAPFGKRLNIRKYCDSVLKLFVEEYKPNDTRVLHKKKFEKQRELFLKQYELVKELEKDISQICLVSKSIPEHLKCLSVEELSQIKYDLDRKKENFNTRLKVEQAELMKLEETRPKGFLWWHKDTSTRDSLIAEHKTTADIIKKSLMEIDNELNAIKQLQNYHILLSKFSVGEKRLTPIDISFMKKYCSADEKESTTAQTTTPWFTQQYNREREKLFLYACKLHKEFVTSSKCMRQNMINLMIAWNMFDDCGERMNAVDREAAMPSMIQSIFLLTPVISTTFASAQTFLGDISDSGVLGTLIVDEAGQAQPQMAIGAMFRCRKSIIVGDPKQIEPVVTDEIDMIKQLMSSELLACYKDKKISVQGFADYINPYGTFLGDGDEKEWVGCPLIVHRRCIDPMYSISNVLSYDGTMKQQTNAPKKEKEETFILEKSCWIDVSGSENSGNKDHFVKTQGEIVLKLLEEKFNKDNSKIPNIFIITPFTSVKSGMIDMIRKSSIYKMEPRLKKWIDAKNIGTVHTFQGQGTDEVIFLLGCDKNSISAANWVNKNIVNVAVTRAKFRFYIIGDKTVWMCKPVKVAREYTAEIISGAELDDILSGSILKNDEECISKNKVYNYYKSGDSNKVELNILKFTEKMQNPIKCPKCGEDLVERKGKFGKFLGCSSFPKCRYTKSM